MFKNYLYKTEIFLLFTTLEALSQYLNHFIDVQKVCEEAPLESGEFARKPPHDRFTVKWEWRVKNPSGHKLIPLQLFLDIVPISPADIA